VTNPLEPLMMSLVRGFIDDEDLNAKLRALYQVQRAAHRECTRLGPGDRQQRAPRMDRRVSQGNR
jgi:hypothetical protein